MALISCPNCGANVSDKAVKCPKCGHQFVQVQPQALLQQQIPTQSFTPHPVYQSVVHVPAAENDSRGTRISYKSKGTCMVLGAFLGIFGAHQFYVGNTTKGILYLVGTLFTFGTIPALCCIIDFFVFAFMDSAEFDTRYNFRKY